MLSLLSTGSLFITHSITLKSNGTSNRIMKQGKEKTQKGKVKDKKKKKIKTNYYIDQQYTVVCFYTPADKLLLYACIHM